MPASAMNLPKDDALFSHFAGFCGGFGGGVSCCDHAADQERSAKSGGDRRFVNLKPACNKTPWPSDPKDTPWAGGTDGGRL